MPRLAWRKGLLGKIETVYGTDAAPAGASDAIQIIGDVEVQSIDLEAEEAEIGRTSMGVDASVPSGAEFKQIRFACQLQASGVLGTAPAIKSLLRACGMTETLTALTDAQYDFNSVAADALTLKYNEDGEQHVLLGARGGWEIQFNAKRRPRIMFTFVGLYGGITDVAMPALTLTAWKNAVPMNNVNTTPFTLHGFAGKLYELSLATNPTFAKRNCVGTYDVLLVNRRVEGSLVMEKPNIAAFDYMARVRQATLGSMSLTHGAAAGLKVKVDTPNLQLKPEPKYSNIDGVATVGLDIRATGENNEAKLTFV